MKKNNDFVVSILKRNGLMLKYVAKELRGNIHVVSAALEDNPLALEFVCPPAIFERQLIAKAIHRLPYASKFTF